jgi:DNA-binding transcriptional LysR family regulator
MWSAVELRELRVFLTLAEELHFGRTAERLRLTRSRVSQSIGSLETRIGAKLFERTSRRVRLTPFGEQFRDRIAPLYDELQTALSDLHERAVGVAGILRLGMYSRLVAGPHLIAIVKAFEARHPRCSVQLAETGIGLAQQFESLRRGDLDLLAYRLPFSAPDLIVGPVLAYEERVLVVASDHPLATQDSTCVEDLADYVTTDVEGAPRQVMDAFSPPRTPSGRPIRRTYVHSIAEAGTRAATGELVHPTVSSFLTYYPQPELVAIPIRDLPPAGGALVRLRANKAAKVLAFVETADEVLRERVGEPGPFEA